jgi:hypothetical protein
LFIYKKIEKKINYMFYIIIIYISTCPHNARKMTHPRGFRTPRKDIVRNIKKNKKYKNMRLWKTVINAIFFTTTHCPICRNEFDTPKKSNTRRDAIDHDHSSEADLTKCSFRGRLCQNCNVKEGIALKKSKENGLDTHSKLWAKMVPEASTGRCQRYLARRFENGEYIVPPSPPKFI